MKKNLAFIFLTLIIYGCSDNKNKIVVEKILLFGDSLMSGYGLSEEYHLSAVLEKNLKAEGYNIEIINGSIAGDTSSDGLERIEEALSELNADLIILGLGANDMLRRIDTKQTEQNLAKIIKIIQDKKINIIIAGMVASPTNGYGYKKKFDKIFSNLAKKNDIPLIPFLLEGVALNSELNLSDGLHPNEKGILVISQTVKKSIFKLIK
ncbi:MAG: arylesterase [Candidatus Pelagibacter sp.]